MTAEQLPLEQMPDPPTPDPQLSPDQRRTQHRRDLIAAGIHPATRQKLLPGDLTCAGCLYLEQLTWHSRAYLKCTKAGITHGAATDVRKSWPACTLYRPNSQET